MIMATVATIKERGIIFDAWSGNQFFWVGDFQREDA